MARNWISIVVLLLSTSWTTVVLAKSLRTFKTSESERDDKDITSAKSLSLISMPTIPEFPKINGRPNGFPSLPIGKLPLALQQQEPITSAASLNSDKQPQVANLPNNVVVASNGVEPAEEQVEAGVYSKNNTNNSQGVSAEKANSSEKLQSASSDFNPNSIDMPLQVLHILNVLGSGGSLAQASKPEKDGHGSGQTTANALGYATGQDANVNAMVANTIGVSPQMVTITDTAQASASSSANGTAFSQATLSSNAWTNQFSGWGGGGWQQPPGAGWKKE